MKSVLISVLLLILALDASSQIYKDSIFTVEQFDNSLYRKKTFLGKIRIISKLPEDSVLIYSRPGFKISYIEDGVSSRFSSTHKRVMFDSLPYDLSYLKDEVNLENTSFYYSEYGYHNFEDSSKSWVTSILVKGQDVYKSNIFQVEHPSYGTVECIRAEYKDINGTLLKYYIGYIFRDADTLPGFGQEIYYNKNRLISKVGYIKQHKVKIPLGLDFKPFRDFFEIYGYYDGPSYYYKNEQDGYEVFFNKRMKPQKKWLIEGKNEREKFQERLRLLEYFHDLKIY